MQTNNNHKPIKTHPLFDAINVVAKIKESPLTMQFEDILFEMHVDEDGRMFITAKQVGIGLDYKEPAKRVAILFNRNKHEFKFGLDYSYRMVRYEAGLRKTLIFYQSGIILLGLLSRQPRSAKFRKWVTNIMGREMKYVEKNKLYYNEDILKLFNEFISIFNSEVQLVKSKIDNLEKIIINSKPKPNLLQRILSVFPKSKQAAN